MNTNPFKAHNLIIDVKTKKAISPQSDIKKIPKKKIKKIKCLDSNELTKDETSNKLEKNIEKKNENINNNNIILLKDKNYNKNIELSNYITNRDSIRNIKNINYNKISKGYNFKYFNKNDIFYLLNNRGKTIQENLKKKNKIVFTILNGGESEQKEHTTSKKKKNSYDLHNFNEEDLINKLKNLRNKKMITSSFKKNTIKKNLYNSENQKQRRRIIIKPNISNISLGKTQDNSKPLLYPLQSKMKTYTNISEIIKSNIIQKKNKGKITKQNYESNKNNIIKKIKKKLMNKNENEKENNIMTTNNNDNLINNNSNMEIDFQDIPQRRPGCPAEKNLNIINQTNYLNNKKRIKMNELGKLHSNTTFIKSLRGSKKINKKDTKDKNIINSKLIRTMIKKFQTQRFRNNLNDKERKNNTTIKHKNKMFYVNLQNKIPKSNNKLIKYLNFNLFDSNNRNNNSLYCSFRNNSFSSDFNKIKHQNKIQKNSVINSFNYKN